MGDASLRSIHEATPETRLVPMTREEIQQNMREAEGRPIACAIVARWHLARPERVVPPAATDEKRICWKDDCYPGCRCESLTEPVTRDEFFRTGKHLFSSPAATDEKEPA